MGGRNPSSAFIKENFSRVSVADHCIMAVIAFLSGVCPPREL